MSKGIKIRTDLGYGTAYEKTLLFEYTEHWVNKYNIKSVLEYPTNNLMGNNNEIFDILLNNENCKKIGKNEDVEQMYDLVWNFCEFENEEDSQKFIQNMLDKSNKYVLIITQNYRNLGIHIHRIWHILWRRKWDHGIIGKSSSGNIRKYVDSANIVESGSFDCPWFYFDIYETLSDIKGLLKKEEKKECEFIIMKSLFEKLPDSIKYFVCHHNYLIIKK